MTITDRVGSSSQIELVGRGADLKPMHPAFQVKSDAPITSLHASDIAAAAMMTRARFAYRAKRRPLSIYSLLLITNINTGSAP